MFFQYLLATQTTLHIALKNENVSIRRDDNFKSLEYWENISHYDFPSQVSTKDLCNIIFFVLSSIIIIVYQSQRFICSLAIYVTLMQDFMSFTRENESWCGVKMSNSFGNKWINGWMMNTFIKKKSRKKQIEREG